jgi:hypothetical protein
MSDIDNMKAECSKILLEGNIRFDDKTGDLTFDLSEENKIPFIELAVNVILKDAIDQLSNKY